MHSIGLQAFHSISLSLPAGHFLPNHNSHNQPYRLLHNLPDRAVILRNTSCCICAEEAKQNPKGMKFYTNQSLEELEILDLANMAVLPSKVVPVPRRGSPIPEE